MAIFKQKTPEELAAREEDKRQKKFQSAWDAFWNSPPGQARQAFEAGDHVFQVSFDVVNTTAWVGGIMGTRATKRRSDPSAILNAVCHEGWELINSDFVFVMQKTQSRDFLLSSGQNTAVEGTVMGYYVFRRCPENQVADSQEALSARIWAELGFAQRQASPSPAQLPEGAEGIACADCDQVFATVEDLAAHIETAH